MSEAILSAVDAGVPVVVIVQSTRSPAFTETESVTSWQLREPAPVAPLMVHVRVLAMPAQMPVLALGVQVFRVTVIELLAPGAFETRAYKLEKVPALGK